MTEKRNYLIIFLICLFILLPFFSGTIHADSEELGEIEEDKKVALVLGGGAAWGIAHIGVIDVLVNEGLEFDIITGTSAGSIIGAFHADGYSVDELIDEISTLGFTDFLYPSFDGLGFFSLNRIESYFNDKLSAENIEDLPIDFAVSTTNIDTGEPAVFSEGPLAKLITASSAVPIMFGPVKYDGYWLADGGLVDNLPVKAARELGADIIIAVDVGANFRFTRKPEGRIEYGNRVFNIMRKASYSPSGVDILIAPELDNFSGTDFNNYSEIIGVGQRAAEEKLPEIRELLGIEPVD
ncbi:patatin-like phospholipase family protein [Halanaerobiaceae bacterium Z-7014]|uniref:Patatin-like phospholipase family protein n=1 Tax=Halonatronomonas betaini TaxID=2778430 RepID=A0A931AT98_9FIRM|nr:patatin-like phospholipase family protein [Halonatronomonas betaini]